MEQKLHKKEINQFEKSCIAGGHPNHFMLSPEFGEQVLLKLTKT
jgi:hypothetical protein